MEKQEKMKPVQPQSRAPIQLPMVNQEDSNHTKERNHMMPTIPVATHNMAKKIEYEPLLLHLVNAVIDPDTGEVLQYKYLMKSK